ncbi:MAG: L,D-transpeptidase [Methyloligellaceae bacterium]
MHRIFTRKFAILAISITSLLAFVQPVSAQSSLFGSPTSGKKKVSLKTKERPGTIIVSFGDRKLYKVLKKGKAISYPIAIPRSISNWEGTLPVSRKKVNPSWTPTASMRRENPKLPAFVPGGHPKNPMGVRALYLGNTLYRIHGTDAPWTIGKAVSKGCVRMYNKDVIDLYNQTSIGAKVVVTWKKYKVASLTPAFNMESIFASD